MVAQSNARIGVSNSAHRAKAAMKWRPDGQIEANHGMVSAKGLPEDEGYRYADFRLGSHNRCHVYHLRSVARARIKGRASLDPWKGDYAGFCASGSLADRYTLQTYLPHRCRT